MRFEELYGRRHRRELTMAEAAEILGVTERTFRRWSGRYHAAGAEGLQDRRIGRLSARAVPVDEALRMVMLYGVGKGSGVFVFSNSSSLRIRIAPHVPTYLSILAGHIEFTNAEGWISLAIHLQKSMSSPLGFRRHEIVIGESVSNASAPLPLAEEAHETVH